MPVRLTITEARNWDGSSPSQLKTFLSCPRKWWFDKIAPGMRPPATPAQQRGTRVHALLEEWLDSCKSSQRWLIEAEWKLFLATAESVHKMDDFEISLAKNALGWITQTVDLNTATAEGKFAYRESKYGILIRGVIDVEDKKGVTDYKTTAGWQWVPAPGELKADPQPIVYMDKWFQHYTPDLGRYQHIYMNTSTGAARSPLSFEVTRDRNAELMDGMSDSVAAQQMYSKTLNSTEVPSNPGKACEEYRGCPFQGVCSSYRKNPLSGPNNGSGGKAMGLFEQYQQKIAKEGTQKAKEVANDYGDAVSGDLDATLLREGFPQNRIDGLSVAEKARLVVKINHGTLSEEDLAACKVNPPDGMPHDQAAPKPKAAYMGATFPGTSIRIKEAKATDLKNFFAERWGMDPKDAAKVLKEYREGAGLTVPGLVEEICKLFSDVPTSLSKVDVKYWADPEVQGHMDQLIKENGMPDQLPTEEEGKKQATREPKLIAVPVTANPPKLVEEKEKKKKDPIIEEAAKQIRQEARSLHEKRVNHDKGPRILLIDCVPVDGTPFASFDLWIQPVVEHVQEKMGDELWLADKYAEGRKDVAKLVYAYLEGKPMEFDMDPLPAYLYISTRHAAADMVIGTISHHYPLIIHGVR